MIPLSKVLWIYVLINKHKCQVSNVQSYTIHNDVPNEHDICTPRPNQLEWLNPRAKICILVTECHGFRCDNLNCIPADWFYDGLNELQCDYPACISNHSSEDGNIDCSEGSDENINLSLIWINQMISFMESEKFEYYVKKYAVWFCFNLGMIIGSILVLWSNEILEDDMETALFAIA